LVAVLGHELRHRITAGGALSALLPEPVPVRRLFVERVKERDWSCRIPDGIETQVAHARPLVGLHASYGEAHDPTS
jgi:hypothetical protein